MWGPHGAAPVAQCAHRPPRPDAAVAYGAARRPLGGAVWCACCCWLGGRGGGVGSGVCGWVGGDGVAPGICDAGSGGGWWVWGSGVGRGAINQVVLGGGSRAAEGGLIRDYCTMAKCGCVCTPTGARGEGGTTTVAGGGMQAGRPGRDLGVSLASTT